METGTCRTSSQAVGHLRASLLLAVWATVAALAGACAQKSSLCEAPLIACGSECIDPQTDPRNCGSCGNGCAPGNMCSSGSCVLSCPATQSACPASGTATYCADFNRDASNCGSCGNVCEAGKKCSSGACVLSCPATQSECPASGTATYCADFNQDVNNCGSCGNACEPGKKCSSGTCLLNCPATQSACPATGTATYCADLSQDRGNCGTCGNACSLGKSCVSGLCCQAGDTACGGVQPYCADLQSDPNNCGTCGFVCPNCTGGTCPPPAAPHLLAPISPASATSKQPTLRWAPSFGATSYLMELCTTRACAGSPVSVTTSSTSAVPPTPLARGPYYWRVTASGPGGTSQSPVWEFFVGHRSAGVDTSWVKFLDMNADGKPDVGIGSGGNAGFVYLNSGNGLPASPSTTLSYDAREMGNAGDVNGDGIGDLVVGTPYGVPKRVYVFHGSTGALSTMPATIIDTPNGGGTYWGTSVAGVGDTNRDGYADIMACFERTSPVQNCYLFRGGPGGVSTTNSGSVPANQVAGAGDVNGDGFADVLVASPFASTTAAVMLYLGGPSGLTLNATLGVPAGETSLGEAIAGAGDVNGDGFADVVATTGSGKSAYVYLGSASGLATTPIGPLPGISGGGFAVTTNVDCAGDVNADGFDDVIFGLYNGNRVRVFHGSLSGTSTTAAADIPGPTAGAYAQAVLGAGDVNGDGFDDVLMAPSQCSGHLTYVLPGTGSGVDAGTPLNSWTPPAQCLGNAIAR